MTSEKKELLSKIEGKEIDNKFRRLIKKFKYAFQGLVHAVTGDTSFNTHIAVGFVVCIMALLFKLNRTEIMFLLSAIFIVLITELINTAVEESINLFTKEIKRGAMIAKDSAAASVLMATIYAIFVGIIIFGPRILELISKII